MIQSRALEEREGMYEYWFHTITTDLSSTAEVGRDEFDGKTRAAFEETNAILPFLAEDGWEVISYQQSFQGNFLLMSLLLRRQVPSQGSWMDSESSEGVQ